MPNYSGKWNLQGQLAGIKAGTWTGIPFFVDNGEIYTWGLGSNGRIGNNAAQSVSSPVQLGSETTWNVVSAGFYHALAVKTDGTLWAWGQNTNMSITEPWGTLGIGISAYDTNRSSPVQVGSETNWATASTGRGEFSLAVTTDGELYAWGFNDLGQLGDGTVVSRSSPVQIGALTNWSQVSVGNNHALALKTDGTLWAWGGDGEGAMGTGDATKRSSPVQIGSDTDWSQISAGQDHSVVLKTDGSAYAMGRNDDGQLGTGDRVQKYTPAVVLGPAYAQVAAGGEFSIARSTANEIFTWGARGNGRLGDNAVIDRSSPVQVGALTTWSQIDAGAISSYAVKNDNTLWAWGGNGSGRLGINDTIDMSSPVQIGSETNWAKVSSHCGAFASAITRTEERTGM
jgi:alpha-tubulin suppressor-like RCC1 family protein